MPQLNPSKTTPTPQGYDPISILAQAIAGTLTSPQNQQIEAQQKSQQQLLSPYQEGVKKALKHSGEQHTLEAIQQGVSPEHIVKESGLSPISGSQNFDIGQLLAQSPLMNNSQKQQPMRVAQNNEPQTNQQAQPQINVPKQGFFEHPDNYGKRLLNVLATQKILGQEPLQAGEREKIGLEAIKDISIKQLDSAAKLAESGMLKPEHIFNKFETASVPFITLRDAHSRIEESAKDVSGASDLALIFNYMKVLDPGSTVREGEFATAENSRGVPETIRNLYNKFSKGGRLSKEQRADFLNTSRRIFKGAEKQQMKTTEQFKTLAKNNNIDFSRIVRDTGMAVNNVPEVGMVDSGFKFKGGDPSDKNNWEKVQ